MMPHLEPAHATKQVQFQSSTETSVASVDLPSYIRLPNNNYFLYELPLHTRQLYNITKIKCENVEEKPFQVENHSTDREIHKMSLNDMCCTLDKSHRIKPGIPCFSTLIMLHPHEKITKMVCYNTAMGFRCKYKLI